MSSVNAELLLRELRRAARPMMARELASALACSQPTLSRLLREAVGVVRIGRGRATRYAALRALPDLGGDALPVHEIDAKGHLTRRGALHTLERGTLLQLEQGSALLFEGLPPFVADMSPQGFIGRRFAAANRDLGLPPQLSMWTDDHRLIALARRGEDCAGNLLLGAPSLDRWLASGPTLSTREDYPRFASGMSEHVDSSVEGEHPKFTALIEGQHRLVKYMAPGEETRSWHRRRDLLLCEAQALDHLAREGHSAARARWFDRDRFRFLEIDRFDRIGPRGRRGIITARAVDNEYLGVGGSWSEIARALRAEGRLGEEEEREVRWLDTFGALIANGDRHWGNLSFFTDLALSWLRLAPVYDMLPTQLAPNPVTGALSESLPSPAPPTAANIDVWPSAAASAQRYWRALTDNAELSDALRRLAEGAERALALEVRRLGFETR